MSFKENNPGHRFEAGLVAALARLAPEDVIVPIAVDRERSWLLTDDQGTTLTHLDVDDQPTRCIVVRALARLQCALPRPPQCDRALRDPSSLHPARPVTECEPWPGSGRRCSPDIRCGPGQTLLKRAEAAAEVLDRRTASLSDIVPLDLELNDVYPANIFADRSTGAVRPRFFDFGNAIWGHPFVSLHGFLDAVVEWTGAPLSRADRDELLDIYVTVWRDHLEADPQVLRSDLAATEALVGVHRLVSWLRLVPYADPIEIQARAEIPRNYLASVAALAS